MEIQGGTSEGAGGPHDSSKTVGAPQGEARPAVVRAGNLLVLAISSILAAAVGFLLVLFAGGETVGTILGLCCGVGGLLVFALSLVAYNAYRRRTGSFPAGPGGPGTPEAPVSEEWVCGVCGADLRPDAKFCAKCGEPVEE